MRELLAHQRELVEWARGRKGPLFINDETGLGKSVSAIAVAQQDCARPRMLIVAPGAILQRKWIDELASMGLEGRVLTKSSYDATAQCCYVVSYEAAKFSLRPILLELAGQLTHVVFDESDKLGNSRSKRTRSWRDYMRRCRARALMLSATAVKGRPLDIISQYKVARLDAEVKALYANTFWESVSFMKAPRCIGWRSSAEANELLGRRRIRRRKNEVLDIPPLMHANLEIPIDGRRLRENVVRALGNGKSELVAMTREHALSDYLDRGRTRLTAAGMRVIQEVLQQSSLLKAAPAAEYTATLAESEQVVVFGYHVAPLQALAAELARRDITFNPPITGATPGQRRIDLANAFAEGGFQVFIATYGAAGVGIDLYAANRMVILEQDWSPGVMQQAFNRIHRIGQTGATYVDVIIGKADGDLVEIELSLARNHKRKIKVADEAGYVGSLGSAALDNPSLNLSEALL